jgi:hypothetical protein
VEIAREKGTEIDEAKARLRGLPESRRSRRRTAVEAVSELSDHSRAWLSCE